MPDDETTESVSIQLADVVQIVECGKAESNQYLEAGYVLLAAVGYSSLRKATRENGTPMEWVKRDVRYALGRRSSVPHFTPEKPDWLKEKESPSHCQFVLGNIHCDRTLDHEGPHEGHVRFVFGDGLQPWMALARHEPADQLSLGLVIRCGFAPAGGADQRCILPPYHFGPHNLLGDVGFQEPPVLPGTHEDAAPAAEGVEHCEFAVGARLCVLKKGHEGRHSYGSSRGLAPQCGFEMVPNEPCVMVAGHAGEHHVARSYKDDEPSAPPAECGEMLHDHNYIPHRCVLAPGHEGLHRDSDGIVFSYPHGFGVPRVDEPSAPPANEDPGTGVPT